VREQAKASSLSVVGFLEKLNVSRLRAFWWSRMFSFFQSLGSEGDMANKSQQ
jgi:hypothetical protein